MSHINWNYGLNDNNEVLHQLVLLNGLRILRTTRELKIMGIIK